MDTIFVTNVIYKRCKVKTTCKDVQINVLLTNI